MTAAELPASLAKRFHLKTGPTTWLLAPSPPDPLTTGEGRIPSATPDQWSRSELRERLREQVGRRRRCWFSLTRLFCPGEPSGAKWLTSNRAGCKRSKRSHLSSIIGLPGSRAFDSWRALHTGSALKHTAATCSNDSKQLNKYAAESKFVFHS